MESSSQKKLNPLGVNLAAMLNIYDRATAELSPEARQKLNKKIVTGEVKFEITEEEAIKERAIIRNMEMRGIPREESEKEIQVLLDAGLDFMVVDLGKDETNS